MAAEKGASDCIWRRPVSAPKAAQMSNIPKIILEGGSEETTNAAAVSASSSPSCIPVSLSASTSPVRTNNSRSGYSNGAAPWTRIDGPSPEGQVSRNKNPVRSSSDIGLPASSMPNLALQMGVSEGSTDPGNENHLGVYCSPRTSRRSVDLDINSKEETRGQYEWIETIDSSSNSLKVLTASSRVGSALSLNSEYTNRSIGLLSNDSDSDDLSLSEKDTPMEKPPAAQLRRYLSYPEESPNQDTNTRPSQSLCNLKQIDSFSTERALRTGKSLDCSYVDKRRELRQEYSSTHSSDITSSRQSEQELSSLVLEDVGQNVDECVDDKGVDSVKKGLSAVGIRKAIGFKRSDNILCYKCDTNASSRDGRIRQWLQDMDRHSYAD